MSSETAVRANGLSKRYGDTLALDRLDLAVAPGEVYGFLGPNGAGKTTTIRLLLGLHRPTAGRSELFGVDAWRDPWRRTGVSPTWPVSRRSGRASRLRRRSTSSQRSAGDTDAAYRDVLVDRFKLDTRKKIRALSKGNRQKVQLVAAFATRADLLILDEPTSGSRPAHGDGVPRDGHRGQGARPDRLPVVAHPQRGGGALRSSRDLAGRPTGRRGLTRRPAPSRRSGGGGDIRRTAAEPSRARTACGSSPAGANAQHFEVTGSWAP